MTSGRSRNLTGEERREDTNDSIKLILRSEVLFGKDSAQLGSAAGRRIEALAEELKRHGAKKVEIAGYTDDLGSYEHGKVLSEQRAEAVHEALAAESADAGIAYEVVGHSEDHPVAGNSTDEGRRKNRRVEVSFPRADSG
ncbi:OmpA family protein [Streptomyces sp. NPDC002889]|uniref:OmpA family protein n=1 Tax=Streptomyces sp. NPDC002889 TaxID=3364669 RepID=UPI0036AD1A54